MVIGKCGLEKVALLLIVLKTRIQAVVNLV